MLFRITASFFHPLAEGISALAGAAAAKLVKTRVMPAPYSTAMTSQSLNHRLNALVDAQRTTIHLINRLSKLPTHLGSSASQGVDGDARVELSSETHQNLKEQEEALELLRQEVEDFSAGSFSATFEGGNRGLDREGDKARLVAQVSRLGEDLKQ